MEKLLYPAALAGWTVPTDAFIVNKRITKVEDKVNSMKIDLTKVEGNLNTLAVVYVVLERRVTVAEQGIQDCQDAQGVDKG